jgi:hypothetical protein
VESTAQDSRQHNGIAVATCLNRLLQQNLQVADIPEARKMHLLTRVCWDSSRVYHGCGEMEHGGEALIGLVRAHGDAFEALELAEEVFDEMPPFVHLIVDDERLCATQAVMVDGDKAAQRGGNNAD